ncbi:hypothetical protein MMC34_004627 [Xylographa carneopallida]|nr:hypothetical protein [Xylographa carneopallida]
MLGRLFQSAASTFNQHTSSRPQTPLESVTEEAHTRDLLFPEVAALRSSQQNSLTFHGARLPANARDAADYDDRGHLEIQYPADIRVIIAQDANSHYHQPQVLYDSRPPQVAHSASGGYSSQEYESADQHGQASGRTNAGSPYTPTHRRHHTPSSSIFQSSQIRPVSPTSPRSSDARSKNFQVDCKSRNSPFGLPLNGIETTQGRLAREAREDVDALLGCMFGAPGFRIEPGTKLHVLPRKAPDDPSLVDNNTHNTRPLSSGGFVRQRTPLMRSTSAADMNRKPSVGTDGFDQRISLSQRSSIMLTKLFSIQLSDTTPTAEDADAEESEHGLSHEESRYSQSNEGLLPKGHNKSVVKLKKVPMYAMAVIIQLPTEGPTARSRMPVPPHALSSLGSSFNEVTPGASWTTETSMFSRYMDMRVPGSISHLESSLNGYTSGLLTHWNIITKALEVFELEVKLRLFNLLEQTIPLAPLISAPPPKLTNTKSKKAKQPTQQSVHVQPGCLQSCSHIKVSAERTGQRIVGALRTRRVATGQGRWGAWREEARWVGRWAGGRNQNFFFFNFITAFLGYHTSWLESFGPFWLKRRQPQQHNNERPDGSLNQRTVIISTDKMAARRLIFLLAAFLPTSRPFINQLGPYMLKASKIYSESPPSVPMARKRSLRRTVNNAASDIHKDELIRNGHARSVSFSLLGSGGESESYDYFPAENSDRRMSDTKSLRSTNLTIPPLGNEIRKASTSTIIAESAAPVPHFASLSIQPPSGDTGRARPGSSGSLASIALNHTLQRSDSTAMSTSGSAGRWGSVVSGFWSNRRGSSTDDSEAMGSSQDASTDIKAIPGGRKSSTVNKLAQMAEEVSSSPKEEVPGVVSTMAKKPLKPIVLDDVLKPEADSVRGAVSSARSILRKSKPRANPLKMSFNAEDGYIDIEMPQTRSFASSLDSSLNSSRAQNHLSGLSHNHDLPYGFPTTFNAQHTKSDPLVDVAGWLKSYHPDFTLQSVRPYTTLKQEIKESMCAESRLEVENRLDQSATSSDEWADVCSTLIADTTNFSICRLTLRRRPLLSSTTTRKDRGTKREHATTPPLNTRNESSTSWEEVFVEEQVMDMDPTLIDAVERVLAQSGHSSRVPSRAPSPSRGGSIRTASRAGSVRDGISRASTMDALTLELPHSECRNMVLGALAEVVRSVVAEQSEAHRTDGDGNRRSRPKDMPDSTLREGIRRWLSDIEDGG